jgi:hypothetical protein
MKKFQWMESHDMLSPKAKKEVAKMRAKCRAVGQDFDTLAEELEWEEHLEELLDGVGQEEIDEFLSDIKVGEDAYLREVQDRIRAFRNKVQISVAEMPKN